MKYLYFSAPWCGPCRQYGPVMERVGQTVPVQKVNVDENQQLAMEYSVRSVPTVILIDESGKEFARHVGVKDGQLLVEQYNNFNNA
jgi:thioredoxin 1